MMRNWLMLLAMGCSSSPDLYGPPLDSGTPDSRSTADTAPPDTGRTRDGLYDLQGLGRELTRDDLLPIAYIVRDKSVVALGESIHTSGGFMQAKTRVLEMLVEDYGFFIDSPEGAKYVGGKSPFEGL